MASYAYPVELGRHNENTVVSIGAALLDDVFVRGPLHARLGVCAYAHCHVGAVAHLDAVVLNDAVIRHRTDCKHTDTIIATAASWQTGVSLDSTYT